MNPFERMQKESAFWAEILSRPDDGLPRQVFADWLDEHGSRDLAFALRWSAERKRFPHITPGGRVVTWWRQPAGRIRKQGGKPNRWTLHAAVYEQMRPRGRDNRCKSKTVPEAFRKLADALRVLRDVVGWHI